MVISSQKIDSLQLRKHLLMSWLKRRKYTDPIHKIYAKYFISVQIKASCLSCFDSEFVNLINSLSKDEVSKSDLYLLDENTSSDNQQYLKTLLKLDFAPDRNYLLFFDKYLIILNSNNSKSIKELIPIDAIFYRGISRYMYQFVTQISQNTSPITESKETLDDFLLIIHSLLGYTKNFDSNPDILLFLQQFFQCCQNNHKLIVSNQHLGEFISSVFNDCLTFLTTQLPFKAYELTFLFAFNLFHFFITNISTIDLLPVQFKQLKNFLKFVSQNYKFISSKFPQQLKIIHQSLLQMCINLPHKSIAYTYSLGKKIVSFYIETLPFNLTNFIQNDDSLNLVLFLVWTLDNYSIEKNTLPMPKTSFSSIYFPSEIQNNIQLTYQFFTCPPFFTIENEIDGFYSFEALSKSLPECITKLLDKYVELLTKINKRNYYTKALSYFSSLLNHIIHSKQSAYQSIHSPNEVSYFIGLIFSYIGLKLPLKPIYFGHFLGLLSKFFYADDESNYLMHSFCRQFVYLLYIKIFRFNSTTVIEYAQNLIVNCQLHIVDELLILFWHLLDVDHNAVINFINVNFFSTYFVTLLKITENRTVLFQVIKKIFEFQEGRSKFLSNSDFVNAIFSFLFSNETIHQVSAFLLDSYSHDNPAECLTIACNAFTQIFRHSELPDCQWIDFFTSLFPLLMPILYKTRTKKMELNENSALLSQLSSLILSLKYKEERILFAPILTAISVFTQHNQDFRMKCLAFYTKKIDLFESIQIDSIDDEIVQAILFHIFECNIESFEDLSTSHRLIKNPNGLLLLHNSTINSPIHKQLFMKILSVISSTIVNQILIGDSLFPDVIITFLRSNMEHSSYSIFLQILTIILENHFKQKYFVNLSSISSIDENTTQNWIQLIFLIIETLSIPRNNGYPSKFIFLNGESTVISIPQIVKTPLKAIITFNIQLYPKNHCSLISFYSKAISTLFNIEIDHEGKLFIITKYDNSNSSKITETDIIIPKNEDIELNLEVHKQNLTILIINKNETMSSDDALKLEKDDKQKAIELPNRFPDFPSQTSTQIALFNSAKKVKRHSICCIFYYFDLQFGENMKHHICLDMLYDNSSKIQNKLSDFRIEGIVNPQPRTIFDFLKNDSGIYLLFELIGNEPSLLGKFISILNNSIRKRDHFENDIFTILNRSNAYYGFIKLSHSCWTKNSILTLFKFTQSLSNSANASFLLSKIWFNINELWLTIEDKDAQHYLFNDMLLTFFIKYPTFIKNQTSIKTYLMALQINEKNGNDKTIMIDLINILYQYLLIGFSLDEDFLLLKSFMFNEKNIEMRIQINLRMFGLDHFSDDLFIEKIEEDAQYDLFYLLFNDLSLSDREYINQFINEKSFEKLSNYYIDNEHSPNILFDVIILASEFVSSKLLLTFVNQILGKQLFTRFLSSKRKDLREVLLIYILFHSSDENTSNICENSHLIDFYSNILMRNVNFFIPFTFIIQKVSSDFEFDSGPFLRSVFLKVLSNSESVENIDMFILYVYSYIYYLPSCDPCFHNIPLYKLMNADKSILVREKEIKQISLFDFMKICSSKFHSTLFPLRYSLRINEDEEWLDKDLALSLINQFKNKAILNLKFDFTNNQTIHGCQIVSMLFITLIKTNHLYVWETVNFFLTPDLTCNYANDSILKSSIQCIIYSLLFVFHEFPAFDPTFRLFCNRFSECFEEYSNEIASNTNLFDSFKSSEIKVIINSFGEVNRYLLLLLVNYGVMFSLAKEEYLSNFNESINSIYTLPSIEKVDCFDYNYFIDSICADFQYTNDLKCRHQSNYFDHSEKKFLLFNVHFQPYILTDFSYTFITLREKLEIQQDNLIIKPISIITPYKTVQSYFIFRNNAEVIIGGMKSSLRSIKWVIKRSDLSFEFFYRNNGMMIYITFESQPNQETIDKFPCLPKDMVLCQWQKRELSNFDLLLQLNFLSGYSFNILDKYIIFPRTFSTQMQNSEIEDQNQCRDFKKVFPPFNKNLILKLHSNANISNEIDENETELIPELYSVREIMPIQYISSRKLLESNLVSYQLCHWVKNMFEIDLPTQDPEITNDIRFTFNTLNNIKMNTYQVANYRFFSITNENEFVISRFHDRMLIHMKLPFNPPSNLQPAQLHTLLKQKLVIMSFPNITGIRSYTIGQESLTETENPFELNCLIQKIEQVSPDRFFILSTNRNIVFYDKLKRLPSFLDGKQFSCVSSNIALNLMIFVCTDKNVFLTTIDSLLLQRCFMINENDIRWCQIFTKGIVILASTNKIVSFDFNGHILTTSKNSNNQVQVQLLSQITIKGVEYLVLTLKTGNVFIKDPETFENISIVRSGNPVVSFATDDSSNAAILYDNAKTTIMYY